MGTPVMGARTPAQGKGTAPVVKPGATTTPIQPQTPYTPIGTTPQGGLGMGGVAGKGNAPVQPTIPAQGGKTAQPGTILNPANQPTYPVVGSTLPNGMVVTQQGVDQAKALNAAKGQGQVQPVIPQPAPVVAPAPVITPAPVAPAPAGLAGLSRISQRYKAKGLKV